jgi:hypothetical protein
VIASSSLLTGRLAIAPVLISGFAQGTVTSWVEYFKVVLRKQRAPQLRSPVPESRPPQAAGVRHDTDTGPLLID